MISFAAGGSGLFWGTYSVGLTFWQFVQGRNLGNVKHEDAFAYFDAGTNIWQDFVVKVNDGDTNG